MGGKRGLNAAVPLSSSWGLSPALGGGSALWVKHGAYAGLHVPACLAPAPW